MWSYCSRSSVKNLLHVGGGEKLSRIRRRRSRRKHKEIEAAPAIERGLLKVALPVNTLLKSVSRSHAQRFVNAGPAKIRINQYEPAFPFAPAQLLQLRLVVVLPSWGRALVIRMTLGGPPREVSSREVRKAR